MNKAINKTQKIEHRTYLPNCAAVTRDEKINMINEISPPHRPPQGQGEEWRGWMNARNALFLFKQWFPFFFHRLYFCFQMGEALWADRERIQGKWHGKIAPRKDQLRVSVTLASVALSMFLPSEHPLKSWSESLKRHEAFQHFLLCFGRIVYCVSSWLSKNTSSVVFHF